MTQALSRLSNRLFAIFYMIFGAAQTRMNHQTIIHHIVQMNKKQSSTEIINEVAVCFKEIFNYRLFAFVVKKEVSVDVWLDPGRYKHAFESILLKDFKSVSKNDITYLNRAVQPDEHEMRQDLNDLIFYELHEENCNCRIYILPEKRANRWDDEAVHLIFQGCSAALSRQLKIEHLRDAAVIDPLTGCYNRREFESQLKRSVAGAARHNKPLSVFMFDLDYFKRVNDTYGHLAGDRVLEAVSLLVKKNMRSGDILSRYGGEEFIAILPETDQHKAMELAERLREKIAGHPVMYDNQFINVTASFGVSQLKKNSDMTRMIHDADTMLYKAKVNGRNTVMPGVIKIVKPKLPPLRKESGL
ncbi:MAG: GGDEF domain-containing protein [Desulfobacterales bacterium]|nr:GGDEF domain-containing protein [Desulfobacterales bacterium]